MLTGGQIDDAGEPRALIDTPRWRQPCWVIKKLRQQRHPRGGICSECLASTLNQSNRKHPFGYWP